MDANFTMKRPTGEEVNMQQIIAIIKDFILQDVKAKYTFTVGTDSQNFNVTKMVEVIAIHRVGKGGLFFHNIEYLPRIASIRQKITMETSKSLELADGLLEELELSLMDNNICLDDLDLDFQIHCDIGTQGRTKEFITEITMWVESQGYNCCIKPDSYTASGIANKYSK